MNLREDSGKQRQSDCEKCKDLFAEHIVRCQHNVEACKNVLSFSGELFGLLEAPHTQIRANLEKRTE